MPRHACVSVDDLRQQPDLAGCVLRVVTLDDVCSDDNPDGVLLPRPVLRRSEHVHELTFGEQTLERNVLYMFCGTDGRTITFVNQTNNLPIQLFYNDVRGMHFIIENNQNSG